MKNNQTYVIETGVPNPKKRCEAISTYLHEAGVVRRCRRDDTIEVPLGKHIVKLCGIHRTISLKQFEEGCQLWLQKQKQDSALSLAGNSKKENLTS